MRFICNVVRQQSRGLSLVFAAGLLLAACSDVTTPRRAAPDRPRPDNAAATEQPSLGIGGSVTVTAGGSYLPTIYMQPTGLVVPSGVPVRVEVTGEVTRTKTPELLDFCAVQVQLCAEMAFFLGDSPVPPSGVPIVDAAVAYASWDGGTPQRSPSGNGTILTGSDGGELWIGRNQFACNFYTSTGVVGNCFQFGGSYTWTIHADDGSVSGDPASALLRLELISQEGSAVELQATTSDGSPATDVQWVYVPDAGSVIDGSDPGAPGAGAASAGRSAVGVQSAQPGSGLVVAGEKTTSASDAAVSGAGANTAASPAGLAASAGVRAESTSPAYADVSSCSDMTECTTTMPTPSGTYVVTAMVHGVRRAAERRVADTGGEGGGKPLALLCSLLTPVRGDTIDCHIEVKPPEATVEAIQWTFTGEGLQRSTVDVHEWKGPMVVSGTIAVAAQVNGSQADDRVEVTVMPRDWTSMVIPYTLAPQPAEMDPSFEKYVKYPRDIHDLAAIKHTTHDVAGRHVDVVGIGPNSNVAYLKDLPYRVDAQVYLHPQLAQATAFWRAQRESAPVYADPKPCLRSDVTRLIPLALVHEGQDMQPKSHAARFKSVLDAAGGMDFEALWAADAVQPLMAAADRRMDELFARADTESAKADVDFKVQLGCVFDYTPPLGKNN